MILFKVKNVYGIFVFILKNDDEPLEDSKPTLIAIIAYIPPHFKKAILMTLEYRNEC